MTIIKERPSNSLTDTENAAEQDRFHNDFLIAFVIILTGIIILVIINLIIHVLVKNQPDQNALEKVILPLKAFAPEQAERTQYMVNLIVFPIFCFIGWLFFNKLKTGQERLRVILYPVIALVAAIGIGLWLYIALGKTTGWEDTRFLYVQGFSYMVWIFFLLFLLVVYIEQKYSPGWLKVSLKIGTIGVGLFFSLTIISVCLLIEPDPNFFNENFGAYFYSVVQVFEGKTLLIDLTNQYGNYPYLLEPILKIVGLGVSQLTAIMGIFLVAFFSIILFLINRLVRSQAISLCASLAIPGTWLFWYFTMVHDQYIQYWPHRILFPGLLLLVVWFYQKAAGKIKWTLYYSGFVASGIALLWNLEVGVVVFGTWVLFLYYETLGQWKTFHLKKLALIILQHTSIALGVIVLSFGSLYIYTFVRSGFFPDMSKIIEYQSIYYGSGFMMLPMPLIHPWNLVILTYMVGICISFNCLVKKIVTGIPAGDPAQTSRSNMIFVISILGAGLFSYYQGRSHDFNLLMTFWSAFFLITIFADDLLQRLGRNFNKQHTSKHRVSNVATAFLFLILSVIVVCYAGGIVELFPKFSGAIRTRIESINEPRMSGDETINTGGPGYIHMDRFAAAATGNVNQIRVRCNETGQVKVALYADSAGVPGARLSAQNTSTPVVAGWNTIEIPETSVTLGEYYWIAFNSTTFCVGLAYQNGGALLYKRFDYSAGLPDPGDIGFDSSPDLYCLTEGWGTAGNTSERLLSAPSNYLENISFITKYFSPGDQVLILSYNKQTIYYMKSATTNPLAIPGFVELIYKSDKQKIEEYLTNGTVVNGNGLPIPVKVIVVDDFKKIYPDLFQLISENYRIIERVNDLTLYEKRTQ